MATSPNKNKSTASSELDKFDLAAKRVRERDAAKKADKEKKSEEPETLKPPTNRGRSDMSMEDQMADIEMDKKMQKAEEAARDLSGKRPSGYKKGGMVTTSRGQGRVMKKRPTRMS